MLSGRNMVLLNGRSTGGNIDAARGGNFDAARGGQHVHT